MFDFEGEKYSPLIVYLERFLLDLGLQLIDLINREKHKYWFKIYIGEVKER